MICKNSGKKNDAAAKTTLTVHLTYFYTVYPNYATFDISSKSLDSGYLKTHEMPFLLSHQQFQRTAMVKWQEGYTLDIPFGISDISV